MRYAIVVFLAVCAPFFTLAQCTLSGSGTIAWNNASTPACQGGGNAGSASVIIIPAGVTLNFDGNADTWTGVRIEVNGSLIITAPGQVDINANIEVKDGGVLRIDSKLNIGESTGCNYNLIIRSGGVVNINGGTPDRLNICGREIARGGTAGCNPYPTGPVPYCEPSSGFTGPVAFDETGVNNALPITLLYFNIHASPEGEVRADWATAMEKNVSHFVLERSGNGRDFDEVARITATGESLSRKEYSTTDPHPLIGRVYYRLKEVDFDGYMEHFNIQAINVNGKKKLYVYPNPLAHSDLATLALNFQNDAKCYGRVTDLSGRELSKFSFTGTEVSLPNKFGKGTYLITVTNGHESFVTRLVVP